MFGPLEADLSNTVHVDLVPKSLQSSQARSSTMALPRQDDLFNAVRINDKAKVVEVLSTMKVVGATGRESDGELPSAFIAAVNVREAF